MGRAEGGPQEGPPPRQGWVTPGVGWGFRIRWFTDSAEGDKGSKTEAWWRNACGLAPVNPTVPHTGTVPRPTDRDSPRGPKIVKCLTNSFIELVCCDRGHRARLGARVPKGRTRLRID